MFCGGAQIGLEVTNEPGHPYHGFIPVTPIMDTQLDDLVIRDLLTPLTERLLKRLNEKIFEQKRENWMEIYFAMFIIMSNIGWILKDMVTMTTWKGLKVRTNPVLAPFSSPLFAKRELMYVRIQSGSRGGTLTQAYMHACRTLLAHFHFACAGSTPISTIVAESNNGGEGRYSGMKTEYLRSIHQEIQRQGELIPRPPALSLSNLPSLLCSNVHC